jgi:FkbM family methyltransferase
MPSTLYHTLVKLADSTLPRGFAEIIRRSVRDWRSERNKRRREAKRQWWDAQRGTNGTHDLRLTPTAQIRLRFEDELSRMIYLAEFETEELLFVARFLRPGDTFVDIGANLGLFSIRAADIVGPTGCVHAFEPCAKTFGWLRENIALNHWKHVHLHPVALSDRTGVAELITATEGKAAYNSLAKPYVGGELRSQRVDTTTWDAFVNENGLAGKVVLMKIDVEGWETKVLAGATGTLSRPDAPVLQVEFTEDAAQSAGSSTPALFQQIEAFGYGLYRWNPWESTLQREAPGSTYPYINLFAIKDLDAAMARLHATLRQP